MARRAGSAPTARIDALLDERRELTEWATSPSPPIQDQRASPPGAAPLETESGGGPVMPLGPACPEAANGGYANACGKFFIDLDISLIK
jgi:hypothetical protein